MIHVIAIVTTQPGLRAEVLEQFHANMPNVHKEKGCVEYQPTIDADGVGALQTPLGPDTFVVVEKWETIEDLRAHGQSAHMAAYSALTRAKIAGRIIHVLTDG
jgi:quinol monooxygenase YgiN